MLIKIFNTLMLMVAFKTPYPYLIGLGILGLFLAWCGTFIKIKNGFVGWLLFITMFSSTIAGLFLVQDHWKEDPALDNTTARVESINHSGFMLDTGERIVPAGIEMPRRKYLRELNVKTMEFLEDKPVKLYWDSRMDGYRMVSNSGNDVSEFLVSSGYAKTSANASDKLKNLADEARFDRIGVWSEVFSAQPTSPFGIACVCYFKGLVVGLVFFTLIIVCLYMKETYFNG